MRNSRTRTQLCDHVGGGPGAVKDAFTAPSRLDGRAREHVECPRKHAHHPNIVTEITRRTGAMAVPESVQWLCGREWVISIKIASVNGRS